MDVRYWIATAVLSAGLPVSAQQAEPEQPRDLSPAAMAPALSIDDADDLLAELERADAGLDRFRADILYDKTFAVAGDRQVRIGSLWFESQGADTARRRFAIEFVKCIIGDRLEEEPLIYVFDGEWFVEKHPAVRQMVKKQVVPPGQVFDPLKIGEGPLPIPIGQKRAEITSRFEATLVPSADGLGASEDAQPEEKAESEQLAREVAGALQLRLVPRPGSEQERDFREIRLWYTRGGDGRLLPRMARTVSRERNVSIVKLINVEVNGSGRPPAGLFDVQAPGDWDVHVTPWRGEGG